MHPGRRVGYPHRRLLAAGRGPACCEDTEGNEITEAEGRAICAERFKVSAAVRQARRNGTKAKKLKKAGRGSKESTKAAPASGPPTGDAIPVAGAA